MKKILSMLLILTLILSLCACGGAGGNDKDALKVGFSRKSITPTQSGVQIAGGDASSRLSTGFLDEVSVTCIAITKGDQTFLIFTMDFMILSKAAHEAIETAIVGATGVPAQNILLNCTHTHSGVNINSTSWDGGANYRNMVATNSGKAAVAAIEDQSPATISIGATATEGLANVRHYRMNDGTTYGNGHGSTSSGFKEHLYEAANEVQAIKFTREAEDKKDIIIMSFPAHATTVNGTNRTSVSACYPGATRAHIEASADVHCAFFQGASGDQTPGSKIGAARVDPQDHKVYGQILGDYVLGLEYTEVAQSDVILKSWDYTGKSMKEGTDDPDKLAAASEIKSVAAQYGSSHANVDAALAKYPGMFYNYYEASGLVERSTAPETRTMTLNVLQLGSEVAMVFAPYEMFGMHGEGIKEGSPYAMDFIVTCSEVYMGYLPHIQGCEESFYEYDVTKFERGTGETLVEEYVNALTELKTAE